MELRAAIGASAAPPPPRARAPCPRAARPRARARPAARCVRPTRLAMPPPHRAGWAGRAAGHRLLGDALREVHQAEPQQEARRMERRCGHEQAALLGRHGGGARHRRGLPRPRAALRDRRPLRDARPGHRPALDRARGREAGGDAHAQSSRSEGRGVRRGHYQDVPQGGRARRPARDAREEDHRQRHVHAGARTRDGRAQTVPGSMGGGDGATTAGGGGAQAPGGGRAAAARGGGAQEARGRGAREAGGRGAWPDPGGGAATEGGGGRARARGGRKAPAGGGGAPIGAGGAGEGSARTRKPPATPRMRKSASPACVAGSRATARCPRRRRRPPTRRAARASSSTWAR